MTDPVNAEERTAGDYMAWSKPELCRALVSRVNELKRVMAERDQYKQIAELNAETIKRMQSPPERCKGEHAWSGPFCVVCGQERTWSFS